MRTALHCTVLFFGLGGNIFPLTGSIEPYPSRDLWLTSLLRSAHACQACLLALTCVVGAALAAGLTMGHLAREGEHFGGPCGDLLRGIKDWSQSTPWRWRSS